MKGLLALVVALVAVLSVQDAHSDQTQPNPEQSQTLTTPEEWGLAFMLQHVPLTRPTYIAEARETPEERLDRYKSIANDIREVVWNEPPVFGGQYGRSRTTAVLLSLMFFEGGFRKDVDFGVGARARGDKGRSWCLLQLNVGTGKTPSWNRVKNRYALPTDPPEQVTEGFTGQEMVGDRKKCIMAGWRALHGSCGPGMKRRLQAYASGTCQGEAGQKESFARMQVAMRWFDQHPPTWEHDDKFVPPPADAPETPTEAPSLEVSQAPATKLETLVASAENH